MSRKERRRLKSRLDKLTRGMRQMGRYSLPAVIAALIGCVPPPNVIHVSDGGRYVVVPYSDGGVNVMLDKKASLVMIDLRTNMVTALGQEVTAPCWIDHVDQTVAFTHLHNKRAQVRIISGLEQTDLPDAAYPSLSPDGKLLVYATMGDDLSKPEKLNVYDLATAATRPLDVSGIPTGFSPDGKHISFIARDGDDQDWALFVIAPDGRGKRRLATLDATTETTFIPRWLADGRLIYRTRTDDGSADGEVFVTDLEGHATQLTDNDIEEAHAQLIDDKTMVFMDVAALRGKEKDAEHLFGAVRTAKKVDGQWTSQVVLDKAYYFATGGDRVVAVRVVPDGSDGEKPSLVTFKIDKPGELTDLDAVITGQLPGLGEN